MADPLSIAVGIAALLQLTGTALHYVREVKESTEERQRLLAEIASVSGLLYHLKDTAERNHQEDAWTAIMELLQASGGPFEQFRVTLENLISKLRPTNGLQRLRKALKWPFDKAEIRDILVAMERQKSLFTLALQNNHLELSRVMKANIANLHDEIGSISKAIRSLQINQDHHLKDRETQDILAWLSPLNFSIQQSDLITERQEGTGGWVTASDEFQAWCQGSNKTLVCTGIPGAGKTVLTSIIVDYLQRSIDLNDVGIFYMYCSYRNRYEQTTRNLVASLLKQMCQRNGSVSSSLKRLYHAHAALKTRPSLNEVLNEIDFEMSKLDKTYLVIDALDELSDDDGTRGHLLSTLRNLRAKSSVNLMVTSRSIPNIMTQFAEDKHLEIRASDSDLQCYLDGQMSRLGNRVLKSDALRCSIRSEIIKAADGMFLLARLHFESLIDKTSIKAIKNKIASLPQGSDALKIAYDEAMERVLNQKPGFKELAEQVLRWILFAESPITVSELQCALAVEPGETKLDEENLPEVEDITSVCAGLVILDKVSNVVRLVHYTTREYLGGLRSTLFPDASSYIARTCLHYLQLDDLENYCGTDDEFNARLRQNVFLRYAAREWGFHALLATDRATQELALKFLSNYSKVSCSAQAMLVSQHRYHQYSQNAPQKVSGAHLCAYYGLTDILVELLDAGMTADSRDSALQTPLMWAIQYGQESLVNLLLSRKDVAVDCRDSNGWTCLSWAVARQRHQIVRMLLDRDDVDVEHKDLDGQTPLSLAAERGHVEIIRILLEREEVDVNSQSSDGWTPITWAAILDHRAVVKLLLQQKNINLNVKDLLGHSPFTLASANEYETVIQILNKCAANLSATGLPPLWYPAIMENEKLLRLLLESRGIDVNVKDPEFGRTALSWAVFKGNERMVEQLLATNRVELDAIDMNGRTPLNHAVLQGKTSIVEMLLATKRVNVNARSFNNMTMLSWATLRKRPSIIQLLLENGAGPEFEATTIEIDSQIDPANAANQEVNQMLLKYFDLDSLYPPHASFICDECNTPIPDEDFHYHCNICDSGNFDVCQNCVDNGNICRDQGHRLTGNFYPTPPPQSKLSCQNGEKKLRNKMHDS